jgi:hypothetical protein
MKQGVGFPSLALAALDISLQRSFCSTLSLHIVSVGLVLRLELKVGMGWTKEHLTIMSSVYMLQNQSKDITYLILIQSL